MAISTIGTNGLNQAANTILCGTSGNVGIGTSSPATNLHVVSSGNTNTIRITDTGVNGAGIGFSGNGATNPNKVVRAWNGNLQVINNAYSAVIFQIDDSGVMSFNSGYGSVAAAYGCRAWVNFNGTGTVAIRASGNVTSITDNGIGVYTVNFTTALSDANYAVAGMAGQGNDTTLLVPCISSQQTTSVRINTTYVNTTGNYDTAYVSVSIVR